MIILVGKSACGKTTIASELIKNYGFKKFVTHTTRAPRIGEINHQDYHFDSKEEFLNKKANNEFIETAEYNGNYYGSSFDEIGLNKVIIVEINGANAISEIKDEAISHNNVFFYLECSDETAKKRMELRNDKKEDIEKRLKSDRIVFDKSLMKRIDFIINTDLDSIEECTNKVFKLYNEFIEKNNNVK